MAATCRRAGPGSRATVHRGPASTAPGAEPAAEKAWRGEISHGGLLYYRGLTGKAASRLLEVLASDRLAERQNDSPTVGTFLRAAAAHPEVELRGYCVGPERDDERFAVEGLRLYATPDPARDLYIQHFDEWSLEVPEHEERCQCQKLWQVVQTQYGVDDAITFPTRLTAVRDYRGGDPRDGWLLWWT